jgi:CHAD domain-containing protein
MDASVHFPVTPKAVKAAPLKLSRRMSAEQAFERIVGNCLAQIAANEEGVTRCHDAESLHQMRVGLRRLRAALAMFDDLLVLPPNLSGELDWLAGELGPARDWDVLLASTLPEAGRAMPADGQLQEVTRLAQDSAAAMHARVATAVGSPRYRHLMAALHIWCERRAWRDLLSETRQARLNLCAADVAAAILEEDQRRLEKRGRKLKEGGAQERHRLRIAAKRTRYATEFFASLFPQRRVRPYVAALTSLQEELGAMNDAVVADRLLTDLAREHESVCTEAGFVRGYLAARAKDGIAKLGKVWKKFKPLKVPH